MSKAADLTALRATPCLVCGRTPSEACHIRSKGASGVDDIYNLMPLCTRCHDIQHDRGMFTFIRENPPVRDYIMRKGWFIECVNGKQYLRRGDDA